MTLTDAGPLVALLDAGEVPHRLCVEALATLTSPLITTWPAFTEAMYLLGSGHGWRGQEALWQLVLRGDLEIAAPDRRQWERAAQLMDKYRDVPMDLADATLVALAEKLHTVRMFTLDSDFRVYRLYGRKPFVLIPGPP